ncbi:MAG: hypothetical protein A2542_00385 [Parcubacteria group bacterium RIFOXYD2_FULL_52_8]|nr:MAG: hypothetical protein A2542_00385 [Parcubacteria group bacterium RIFOXYD2_FULL_52_8]
MVKKALVTGASSGIGYAFAKRLAREGYAVTAVARRADKLQQLQAELVGTNHHSVVADLATTDGLAKVTSLFETDRYQLVINNAGAGLYENFADAPLDTHERIMRLNCSALVAISHTYLKTAERGDALINVSSILSFLPYPSGAIYAATKAFVLSLTESLWYEQQHHGVYVAALCPGVTESGFHEAAGGGATDKPAAWLTQTADDVVAETLHALRRRKQPVIISGWKNRLGLFLTRFLSYKRIVSMMGKW